MSKKLQADERKMYVEEIKALLLEGKPYLAVALKLNLKLEFVQKITAELLVNGELTGYSGPSFEIVPAGIPAKRLPFLRVNDCTYFVVEKHGEGILIKPYKKEGE